MGMETVKAKVSVYETQTHYAIAYRAQKNGRWFIGPLYDSKDDAYESMVYSERKYSDMRMVEIELPVPEGVGNEDKR